MTYTGDYFYTNYGGRGWFTASSGSGISTRTPEASIKSCNNNSSNNLASLGIGNGSGSGNNSPRSQPSPRQRESTGFIRRFFDWNGLCVILPLDERGDVWTEFSYYQPQNNYQYQLIHHMQHPMVHATLHAETSGQWYAQVPKEFQCKTDANQHRYLRSHADLHTHICIYANSVEGRKAMEQYLYTPIPSMFAGVAGASMIKSVLKVYPCNTPPEPLSPDGNVSGHGNSAKKRKSSSNLSSQDSPRNKSNNGSVNGADAGADAMTWIQCEDCERWLNIDVSHAQHLESTQSSFFCHMVSPPIACLNPEEQAAEAIKWEEFGLATQAIPKAKKSQKGLGQGGSKAAPLADSPQEKEKEKEYPYTACAFDDSMMGCNSCGRLAYRRDVLKGRLCSCGAGTGTGG